MLWTAVCQKISFQSIRLYLPLAHRIKRPLAGWILNISVRLVLGHRRREWWPRSQRIKTHWRRREVWMHLLWTGLHSSQKNEGWWNLYLSRIEFGASLWNFWAELETNLFLPIDTFQPLGWLNVLILLIRKSNTEFIKPSSTWACPQSPDINSNNKMPKDYWNNRAHSGAFPWESNVLVIWTCCIDDMLRWVSSLDSKRNERMQKGGIGSISYICNMQVNLVTQCHGIHI